MRMFVCGGHVCQGACSQGEQVGLWFQWIRLVFIALPCLGSLTPGEVVGVPLLWAVHLSSPPFTVVGQCLGLFAVHSSIQYVCTHTIIDSKVCHYFVTSWHLLKTRFRGKLNESYFVVCRFIIHGLPELCHSLPPSWNWLFFMLNGHDLRLFWSCLSRFKLSLPQCTVPVVFNGMSGRLSGFPSLYWRYLCIRYESYNYWSDYKVHTYGRKSRSLPCKLTKATPGGVKVYLAEKIICSYY